MCVSRGFVPAKTTLLVVALGGWPSEGTARCEIPLERIVRLGRSEVNKSAQSVPKKQGYKVVGDPLNHAGSIRVRLSGVGKRSAVTMIAQLVEEAQSLKAQNSFTSCACCGQRGFRLRLQFNLAPRTPVWGRSRRSQTSVNVSLYFLLG